MHGQGMLLAARDINFAGRRMENVIRACVCVCVSKYMYKYIIRTNMSRLPAKAKCIYTIIHTITSDIGISYAAKHTLRLVPDISWGGFH